MQSTFNLFKALLFACLLLLITPFAQAAFTINNDGTVTPASTATYSVIGANAGGTGAAANVTATVSSLGSLFSGSVAQTVGTDFGGSPYCTYHVDLSNISQSIAFSGDGTQVVASSLSGFHKETGMNSCPHATFTPGTFQYTMTSHSIVGSNVSIQYTSVPNQNFPSGVATFTGAIGTGSISGKLVFNRTDQSAAILNWSVSASIVLNTTTTPVCTLSVNPPTISSGSSSTLTATCNPAATSYTWTGGTCAGATGATCTVAPSAATSYTVTGVNTGGNGNTASAVVRIAGNTTSYTVPGTLDDDVFVLTAGNSYFGGGGNDTYIVSPHTLRGAVTAKIIDNEGTNIVQLANGMTIASSSFFNNAVQLMLSNGAIVQVLGASSFIYQLGANASAGEAANNLNFAQFAAALGASVPAAGAAAVSGSANFVVQH